MLLPLHLNLNAFTRSWKVYSSAKRYLQTGDIDLDTDIFRMGLFKASSNASTYSLSTIGSVTVPVSGIVQSKSVSLTLETSDTAAMVSAGNVIFTAAASATLGILFAVVYTSTGRLAAWGRLSTDGFEVQPGYTLTVKSDKFWNLDGG